MAFRAAAISLALAAGALACKGRTSGVDVDSSSAGAGVDAASSTMAAGDAAPSELSEAHKTGGIRVHYPASFTVKDIGRNNLSLQDGDLYLRFDAAKQPVTDRDDWVASVVANEAAWRKKVAYVETARHSDKCLAENGVQITGAFDDRGMRMLRYQCIFVRAGYGYTFSYELPASVQAKEEPRLRRILDRAEVFEPVDPVMDGLRQRFRGCYEAGRREDPKLAGSTWIRVKLAYDGAVLYAEAEKTEGLPLVVVDCVATAVRNAHFDAPRKTGSTFLVPVTFEQSDL